MLPALEFVKTDMRACATHAVGWYGPWQDAETWSSLSRQGSENLSCGMSWRRKR